MDYAGYEDPILPKIAFIIAAHFDYEDTSILIKIDGNYYIVDSGWEKGFELAGGLIKYAPTYKEFENHNEFNKFNEQLNNDASDEGR